MNCTLEHGIAVGSMLTPHLLSPSHRLLPGLLGGLLRRGHGPQGEADSRLVGLQEAGFQVAPMQA